MAKLILSFYAIPGQDATYRMRLKDEDGHHGLGIGKHGPFADLAIRSCVSMIIILKFECDTAGLTFFLKSPLFGYFQKKPLSKQYMSRDFE